ncbi:MAG: response regulator, partial [Anaerolineales bacterium]
ARALRRDSATQRIPILAVTARALPEDRRRAYEAGVDDYITKPIDVDAFFATVASLLARARTQKL